VAQNTGSEDGCATLYQILRTTLPKLQDFHTKWGPNLNKNQDMCRFVRIMQEHATLEAEFDRPYKDIEIITNVIQHALDDARYKMTARTAKVTIQSALAQGTKVTLTMQNIAQSLEPSRTTHQAIDGDTPMLCKFDARRPQSLDPKKQVQCRSCQAWGHDGQCFMMCKIVNVNKWIKENPEEAEQQATLFAQSNSKRMVNMLKVEDETALHAGIEDMHTALCDEPEPTITKMKVPNNWEAAAAEYTNPCQEHYSHSSLYRNSSIQVESKRNQIQRKETKTRRLSCNQWQSISNQHRRTSNTLDSLIKQMEEPTLQQRIGSTSYTTTKCTRNRSQSSRSSLKTTIATPHHKSMQRLVKAFSNSSGTTEKLFR
jgi:hypothetical protein